MRGERVGREASVHWQQEKEAVRERQQQEAHVFGVFFTIQGLFAEMSPNQFPEVTVTFGCMGGVNATAHTIIIII